MPEWLVLALAMVAVCAVIVLVTFVQHRRIGVDDDPSETPDVIEYITMMIGVVYAIVLGLAMAGVWEARSAAEEHVHAEARALHEVHERVRVYPAEVRDRIRADVNAYVGHVIDVEWKKMVDTGGLTDRGDALMERIRHDVTDYQPRTDFEAQAYQPLMDQVTIADQARTGRGEAAQPTMPGVVWFGLIVGAVVTLGMMFALQIRRTARELVLAGLFSVLIAFLLFLVWDFDTPYGRSVASGGEPFLNLFPKLGP
jgi:protein-S-isoprenylcysteine O-methyltransferase Ste14